MLSIPVVPDDGISEFLVVQAISGTPYSQNTDVEHCYWTTA